MDSDLFTRRLKDDAQFGICSGIWGRDGVFQGVIEGNFRQLQASQVLALRPMRAVSR
jgi:hypothetical protein